MNKKAIIFDMDGLLIDSMAHWLALDRQLFASYGKEFDEDYVKYMTGRSEQECIAFLKDYFGLEGEVEELLKQKRGSVAEIYNTKTKIMPGVVELINKIKSSSLKQAIASGSPLRDINTIVNRFNWQDYFEQLVSADHVGEVGKPNPAIYLYTAKKLGVDPKDCIVFEDAENGVKSAKDAGMTCIAVPNKKWSFGDFSLADLVVDSLEDKQIFDYLKL